MIELMKNLPADVVAIVAHGTVTRDDYEQHIIPAVEKALTQHEKIRFLYVLGADFTGFAGGAMWEDGRVGLEHLTRWRRIGVVADQPWIRHTVDVLGYMIPGEVKTFELKDEAEAVRWITS